MEFRRLIDETENYLIAANKWYQTLPDRISSFGLTKDDWDRISAIGDNNEGIQNQVIQLIKRLEEFNYF